MADGLVNVNCEMEEGEIICTEQFDSLAQIFVGPASDVVIVPVDLNGN
jgi:hypothetical protein